jgi:GNAT superfamily N-acetyltransferase
MADIPFVVGLVNEDAPEPMSAETMRVEWSASNVDLDRDARIEDDAYAHVETLDSGRVWLNVHGRPTRALLAWMDARAAERAPRALSGAWSSDTALLGVLRDRGFRHVRSSHRMLLCHPHKTRTDCGWVRVLGVRRPWRRRGLGRALLLHAFSEFRRRGLVAAGLGVDTESETGAHRLYESVGMHTAARFDILERQ